MTPFFCHSPRGIVLLLTSALVLLPGCGQNNKDAAASRSPLPRTVTGLGRLEPYGGIIQITAAPGDRVVHWEVKEGEAVEAGKELVILESKALSKQEQELADTQVKEARKRLDAVEVNRSAQLRDFDLKLKRTREGLHADAQLLQEKVNLATNQDKAARENLDSIRSLAAGAVPEQDIKRQELAAESAKVDLASARIMLKKAKDALESSEEEGKAQRKALEATLERAALEIPYETALVNARLARQRYEAGLITAPTPGVILSIVTRQGEAPAARPLLQMGDTRKLAVIAEVDEFDIVHVKVGQRVKCTSRIFADLQIEEVWGVVESIGMTVSRNSVTDLNPAAISDRRVVEVKIPLTLTESVDEKVRQRLARLVNLQVNVAIETDALDR